MLLVFVAIILAGHFYCAVLIFLMNIGMVKEILSLKRNKEKENHVPFSLFLNWYFFAVATFFFYGRVFGNKLTKFVLTNRALHFLVAYHGIISFMLWIFGFLIFVLTLKKGYYRYQFQQFGWTHITILMIVGQSSAIMNNIYEGLIWFILPALLVISNDTFAYLFGFFLGKHKLIDLSPKKTWEGFIGGIVSTLVISVLLASWLGQSYFLTCPEYEFTLSPYNFKTSCEQHPVFLPFEYELPNIPAIGWVGKTIMMSEFQVHACILGMFASLISPFGGFFASGFKRAIKIKDFAEIIPGHGGITDRMDCQVLMGMFAYLYVHQVVFGRADYFSVVTRYIMTELGPQDQLQLYEDLHKILKMKGLLNATNGSIANATMAT